MPPQTRLVVVVPKADADAGPAPQEQLAAAMKRYWTDFAARGFPSSFTGPRWPRFDSASQQVLSLVPPRPQTETGFAAEHHCAFWSQAG